MSRYRVCCGDGREFLDVLAKSAECAKDRVFYWTRGRCPKSEMHARKAD